MNNNNLKERAATYGPATLTTQELLGLITGLKTPPNIDFKTIANSTPKQLSRLGLGPVTAIRLKAAFEFGKRAALASPNCPNQITSPADAGALLIPQMRYLEQEEMWLLPLNTKNHILDIIKIYKGNINTLSFRVAEILRAVIEANATAFIMAHNHPSGDCTPSPEDIILSKQIFTAGQLVQVKLLDHLVIGDGKSYSIKQRLGELGQ